MIRQGKQPWTIEEDSKLISLVQRFGLQKWADIAESMVTRDRKQCRERYMNHLNPDIRKDPWSKEEDQIILKKQLELGNQWSNIASFLVGRTDNSVKSRFRQLTKDSRVRSDDHRSDTETDSERADNRSHLNSTLSLQLPDSVGYETSSDVESTPGSASPFMGSPYQSTPLDPSVPHGYVSESFHSNFRRIQPLPPSALFTSSSGTSVSLLHASTIDSCFSDCPSETTAATVEDSESSLSSSSNSLSAGQTTTSVSRERALSLLQSNDEESHNSNNSNQYNANDLAGNFERLFVEPTVSNENLDSVAEYLEGVMLKDMSIRSDIFESGATTFTGGDDDEDDDLFYLTVYPNGTMMFVPKRVELERLRTNPTPTNEDSKLFQRVATESGGFTFNVLEENESLSIAERRAQFGKSRNRDQRLSGYGATFSTSMSNLTGSISARIVSTFTKSFLKQRSEREDLNENSKLAKYS